MDAEPSLPDHAIEHVSAMLALAKQKHEEAMAMIGRPDTGAIPRLHQVLKLLHEVELLADDANSYLTNGDMQGALKELHIQQASIAASIGRLEQMRRDRTREAGIAIAATFAVLLLLAAIL